MQHPDLEKQLEELKAKRKAATADLRNLASEAVESTDKVNKTMMMYLQPAGTIAGCECVGTYCTCQPMKKRTSRLFNKAKLKKRLQSDSSNGNGTHP
jgi:hypothetical protein